MNKKRLLLIDDHQLIIDGLKGFFEDTEEFTVVGEGNSGEEAIKLNKVLEPDLILMDVEMPGISGIQACEEIKRDSPEVKIIIVSMHEEKELIRKMVSKGAEGYLLKNSSKQEVLSAVSRVLDGENYFSQDVTKSLLNKSSDNDQNKSSEILTLANLTDREVEILRLVAEGKTNKEIGELLFISHRTVDTHRTNLMKKLDLNNVAALIRFAFKNGLVQ